MERLDQAWRSPISPWISRGTARLSGSHLNSLQSQIEVFRSSDG